MKPVWIPIEEMPLDNDVKLLWIRRYDGLVDSCCWIRDGKLLCLIPCDEVEEISIQTLVDNGFTHYAVIDEVGK